MINNPNDPTLFKTIFDSSIEGILVVGHDGVIVKVNSACENLFSYGKGELLGKKVESLIPQKFRKVHKEHRAGYAKKPKTRPMGNDLDLWGLKKNGVKFPVKVSLSPAVVNGKSITIAFVKDVTEIEIASHELRAKEAKDKALLEAMPDMIVIQNYEGDIIDIHKPEEIYASKYLEFQIPKEEIIGKNIKVVLG